MAVAKLRNASDAAAREGGTFPLLDVADDHQLALARVIFAALQGASEAVSTSEVRSTLLTGNVDEIVRLVPFEDLFRLPGVTKADGDAAQAVILETMVDASDQVGVAEGSFELINPRAVMVAREHAASIVLGVSESTRLAIRRIVTRAIRGQLTADAAARLIRNSVGLAPRQAVALSNFAAALEGQAGLEPGRRSAGARGIGRRFGLAPTVPGTRGLSEGDLDRLVARYATRLLRQRATTIARTEIMTAANRGLMLNWQEAAREGLFNPGMARRQWHATGDDRVCPICAPLDGAIVGFNQGFQSTHRARFDASGNVVELVETPRVDTFMVPPAHPACRCALSLII